MIKTDTLKENPNNPRYIDEGKFKKLCKSINEFPKMMELRPIVVDKDNMVLGGNMRLKAITELGFKEIPKSWVKKVSDLTDEQKLEFIIKDNVGFGEWDTDQLANNFEIEELSAWGLDLPGFNLNGETEEDDYEMPDEIETDIKRGDLFEIGEHRLLCGDATDREDVTRLMGFEKADMVFTDPPYGVSIGEKNRFLNSFQKAGRNLKDIKSDSLKPQGLHDILLPGFSNIKYACKDDATYFVTAPQRGDMGMMMMMVMQEAGLKVRHVLIWKKNSPTFSMGRLDYDYQHEPIFLTWTKKHKYYGLGEYRTSVWEIDKPRSNKEHPTMKPIKLIANALLNNSTHRDSIIDFYMGSGPTMVASHQLNRKCYGIEIEPKYCQVILDRMINLDDSLVIKKNGIETKLH